MVVSKKVIKPTCQLKGKGEVIKQVNIFKYLGYMINSDGRCSTEIKRRIAIAKDSFKKMSPIFKNHNILMATKHRVLKAYVWSILLYGCESWTITVDIRKKLEATEMWFLRRMLRISWTEKKTNKEVLEQAETKRSLFQTIRKRQMQFLGHLNRHKGLEHLALTGKIEGRKSRGRQRAKYLNRLNSWVTGREKDNLSFLRISDQRDKWHTMITNFCHRPSTS